MSGNIPPRRPPRRQPAAPLSPRHEKWQPRRVLQPARESVAGDAVLAGEPTNPATPDLSAVSAGRLGGRAIALSGMVVVAGVVLSRLLGWFRVSVVLAKYGAGSGDLTAFNAAFRIPDTLFQLVAAGAVASALVPVASALLVKGEDQRARRLIATIANLMVMALVPLAIVVWLAAPAIVPILFPFPDPAVVNREIELTQWMLISPIFLAMAAAFTAGLNSAGIFGAPALAPNIYNLTIIVSVFALTPFMGIDGLAAGVVIGAAGHMGVQAYAVRKNGLYAPVLDLHEPAVKETLRLMAPRALGLGATQIVFVVNTFFAVQAGNDGLNIYTAAFTALQMPVGLIGVPLGIILLPPLSQAIARGDRDRFSKLADQSLRLTLFTVIPLMGLMLVLATPTIALLFQHGAFTPQSTATTVPILVLFLLGLVAHVLISLLAPIFYAGKDTRTPVGAALLAVAVDVVVATALFPLFHLAGLALAIGVGAWAEVAMLFYFMRHRIGFDLRPLALTVAFAIPGASLASAGALAVFKVLDGMAQGSTAFVLLVVELGLAALAGAAVYLAWSRLLRLPELSDALSLVRTVLGRAA